MKRLVSIFVLAVILILSLTSCAFKKMFEMTDEELIEERIRVFLEAYNTGDMEAVLECLDERTRNAYQGAINITEEVMGSKLGANLKISDIFGVSVGAMFDDGDILSVDIESIDMDVDERAKVIVDLDYKDKIAEMSDKACFKMVKEGKYWYIQNLYKASN